MVTCISQELLSQRDYLEGETVRSIYFGGGTPSLLTSKELGSIIDLVKRQYVTSSDVEVTLEANPENINRESLASLYNIGINRLSVGIQSFDENSLKYMNRVHSANEAILSLEQIIESEFDNFSLDLMFGIDENDMDIWEKDLRTAMRFKPNHISIYNLTIEQETVFGKWLKAGKIKMISEEHCARQFEYARNFLINEGYQHYEISNYSKDGHYSRHNTSYWKDEKYIGVGPGAHSYNNVSRQFNIKNNAKYIEAITAEEIPFQKEFLSKEDRINEYILTSFRTMWGCDLRTLRFLHHYDIEKSNGEILQKLLKSDMIEIINDNLTLTNKGQLLADSICSELMIETS